MTTPRTAPAASTLAAASSAAQQQDLASIEMVCARDQRVIVSVFHDRTVQTPDAQRFAHMMLIEFTTSYGAGLETLKNTLRSMASGSATAAESARVAERFRDFEATVNAFAARVFRSTTAPPAPAAPLASAASASSPDHSGSSTPVQCEQSPSTPPAAGPSPPLFRLSLNDPPTPDAPGRSTPPSRGHSPRQSQLQQQLQILQQQQDWPPEIDCDWPPDLDP